MVLYIIGLGLADEKDITVKGLEAVKKCERVYLESYTSLLLVPRERLEEFYGKSIIDADRELVEMGADTILEGAADTDVAFLVVGDPFGATTHTDLELRARELDIPLYRYGETVSIVFFTETWRPDSFYDKILSNRKNGLHTLCLLDIKTKEPSLESLARGKVVYEPPRFMSIHTAVEQLLEIEDKRKKERIQRIPCVLVSLG
eukprot:jgi/Picre1/32832/NNA_008162.t1